jgi:uncharacterized protein YcbK (DUF882 family)
MPIGRRSFLAGSIGVVGLGGLAPLRSVWATEVTDAHTLSLYNIHTTETLKVAYREQGDLVPEALAEIKHFLRDFRNEQTHDIDVALLDSLHDLYGAFDQRGRFEVISGYRSPATNAALRHATSGVAEHSLHLSGKAIDIRLTSAATKDLRAAALARRRGGVGYYPESNFVHIDTGPFRAW